MINKRGNHNKRSSWLRVTVSFITSPCQISQLHNPGGRGTCLISSRDDCAAFRFSHHTQIWSTCCESSGLGVAKHLTRFKGSSIFLSVTFESHFYKHTFSHAQFVYNAAMKINHKTIDLEGFSYQVNTVSYLRRTTHHQLDEVPATPLGRVDISDRVQPFQGAVLGQAADEHGPLGPFGHPACTSHLLAVGPCGVSLLQIRQPNYRGRLTPPPLPQLHLPSSSSSSSSRGRRRCIGLIILGGVCRWIVAVWLFVIVQACCWCAGCSCGDMFFLSLSFSSDFIATLSL